MTKTLLLKVNIFCKYKNYEVNRINFNIYLYFFLNLQDVEQNDEILLEKCKAHPHYDRGDQVKKEKTQRVYFAKLFNY